MNTPLIALLLFLAIPLASAMDDVCQKHNHTSAIADWRYQNYTWTRVNSTPGHATLVFGTSTTANWTSDPAAAGVIGGTLHYEGGTSGMIKRGYNRNSSVERIVLCKDGTGPQTPVDVPEFGLIAAGIVAIAGVGLVVARHR